MKSLFILLLILPVFAIAQDDERERLKEEIRKEIEAEKRESDLREQLRNEILKEEAIKKAENEKRLYEETQQRKNERAAKKDIQKGEFNEKRLLGWSIATTFGLNIPVGKYGGNHSDSDEFAALGFYFSLDNYWHFGKVMGIALGFSYDENKFDNMGFEENALGLSSSRDTYSTSKPYQTYSIKLGPNIRALGENVSFHFNPFIAMSIHEMADYTINIYDVSPTAQVSMRGNQNIAFSTGATAALNVHFGRKIDFILGSAFTYMATKNAYRVTATGQADQSGIENYEPIRIAPYIGLKFNL